MLTQQIKHKLHNLSTQQMLNKAGYIECEKIADTLQGNIWRSLHKATNKRVVIKEANIELHKKQVTVLGGRKINVYENILREINILNYLSQDPQCPNSIVKYVDAFKSPTSYFLVMEDGGSSLFEFIVKVHNCIKSGILEIAEWHKLAKIIFQQMIESIEYCHSKNVCHFDVSLENYVINDINVAFDNDGKMRFCLEESSAVQVKLVDFGLSELFLDKFLSNKYCGKTNYKSPEIVSGKQTFCAASNDIWALGVCLFMMIIGSAAWMKASVADERFNAVMNGQIVQLLKQWNMIKYVNDDLIQLFHYFFQYEDKRINIYSLKKCLWLNR